MAIKSSSSVMLMVLSVIDGRKGEEGRKENVLTSGPLAIFFFTIMPVSTISNKSHVNVPQKVSCIIQKKAIQTINDDNLVGFIY
jgi:hypothetical protein